MDIEVSLCGETLGCPSSALMRASGVLRELCNSTAAEGWAAGVQVALEGHPLADVKLFLALCRDSSDARKACAAVCPQRCGNDFAGVLALADKLDARAVAKVSA